jgi:hypothetical protein
LVGGALSFVGFALLVIPDHIGAKGGEEGRSLGLGLANGFVRNDATTPANNDFSGDTSSSVAAAMPANPTSRIISRSSDAFPRRGFTPPLERAEPVPAPPPPATVPPAMATPAPPVAPDAFQPPQPAQQEQQPVAQPVQPPSEPPPGVIPPPPPPVGAEAPN